MVSLPLFKSLPMKGSIVDSPSKLGVPVSVRRELYLIAQQIIAATRRVRDLESGWLVSKQAKSYLHPASRLTPPQRSWERHPRPNTAAVGAGRLGVVENLFLRQECLPYLLKRKKREPRLDEGSPVVVSSCRSGGLSSVLPLAHRLTAL